ncbi:DH31 receptor [Sarcoptes scabiei]|nr:DH31 receptor [Sarcoptes scabiei]
MLYLEDYLESNKAEIFFGLNNLMWCIFFLYPTIVIENLSNEFLNKFTHMRELELQIYNTKDELDVKMNEFFVKKSNLQEDIRDAEFMALKQQYSKILEIMEDKIMVVDHMFDLIDKYSKRLNFEIHKFKLELEADNPGITEIIEKRASETDNSLNTNHLREKRKLSSLYNSSLEAERYESFDEKSSQQINIFNGLNSANISSMASSKQIHNSSSLSDNNTNINMRNPNSKNISDKNTSNTQANLSGTDVIQAAASQAIVATQHLGIGRRTASLKASYEAINSTNPVLSNLCNLNQLRVDESTSNHTTNGILNSNDDTEKLKKSRIRRNRNSVCSRNNSNANSSINNSNLYRSMEMDMSQADQTNHSNMMRNYDIEEPLYCYCNNVSYGDMIFCENKSCPYQWFHYECVGIRVVPAGSWFCPTCSEKQGIQQTT